MKYYKIISLFLVAAAIAGCNGLGKMSKNAGTVKYEVTPNPLEMHGDSVAISVKGTYPAKYFAKKVSLTVTPALKSASGEKSFKSINIVGEKVEGNMQRYKALGPDEYYVITSLSNLKDEKKYRFYKFIGGKLAKRKGDKYIIKESIDNKSEVSNIVDCMLDMIEDGYNVSFRSPIGNMLYQQYLDGEGDFHPVYKPNEALIKSQFTIRFNSNDKFRTYDDFVKIIDEMQVVIARLLDSDWILSNFEVKSYEGSAKDPKPIFQYIDYKFMRPDQKLEGERFFNLEIFKTSFYTTCGLNIEELKDYDDMIHIEFSSNYYAGEFPSDLEDRFEKICDRWGFAEYDYNPGRTEVTFHWDEV